MAVVVVTDEFTRLLDLSSAGPHPQSDGTKNDEVEGDEQEAWLDHPAFTSSSSSSSSSSSASTSAS